MAAQGPARITSPRGAPAAARSPRGSATVGPVVGGVMAWLDQHSGAVTAMVTAVYAFFTVLLWRATKRQATLTQRTFEASHRPYLSLRVGEQGTTGAERDALRFDALIENVGAIPAEVTKWEVSATLMDLDGAHRPVEQAEGQRIVETLLGACLFPGREYPFQLEFRHPGIFRSSLPVRLLVTVEYRYLGGSEVTYRTSLEAERAPRPWVRVRAT